ncbi:MAG TPA: glycosyltransferase family 39 protein, partial [Terriglobales bacterium]|nr:glycosyltransferase family 39 protein [Terriglobales bacterium]
IKLLMHLSLSARYGYFRDELYYLDCGRHLSWGYVDHAPMIGLVARIVLLLGGTLPVLRMFPAIAGALLVALTMLMTWRLGGGKFAQALAGLSILMVPIYLMMDSLLTMNAFEPLFWMGCIYVIIRVIQTDNSRLWIWFGVLSGLGLMNKHSTGFFGLAVVIGLLLTEHRREFAKPWIWIAACIAVLIFSPNLIWQIHHHFPTLEDLHNVRVTGKNVELPPAKFILQQILVMHPVLVCIWFAGLWHFLLGRGKKYRLLGWIFLAFLGMMIALHGKDYYVIPIYPMLFAGGAVAWEDAIGRWRLTRGKLWPKVSVMAFITINGALLAPLMLPLLSPEKYVAYGRALHYIPPKQETCQESQWPQPWADQFGWPELVSQVAQAYNSLPPEERSKTGILTGNDGEAGAIDMFGPKYGLPQAMSGHQTYYYWGTHGFNGDNLITLQNDPKDLARGCNSVQKVAVHFNAWGMGEENEPIYLCQGLKKPLTEIWPEQKHWN